MLLRLKVQCHFFSFAKKITHRLLERKLLIKTTLLFFLTYHHAIKFVEAAKSSPKIKIDYFNNEIRIATFNKKTKTVTTYLPSGEMYHRSFKEFKKLMESKLNIDDEKRKHKKLKKIMKLIKIDGKKYKHFQSIAHLFKKD
jgi:hypothetical protein